MARTININLATVQFLATVFGLLDLIVSVDEGVAAAVVGACRAPSKLPAMSSWIG